MNLLKDALQGSQAGSDAPQAGFGGDQASATALDSTTVPTESLDSEAQGETTAEVGVAGQNPAFSGPRGLVGSTMPGINMTQYALVCLGLVAVILGLGWGVKRFLAGNLRLRAQKRSMKVVDMLPLGGKRQLAVVRCYDRTFLLGLGEREVNLVTELDVDEDVEGRLPVEAAGTKSAASFNKLFQRAVRESGTPAASASVTPSPAQSSAPSDPAAALAAQIASQVAQAQATQPQLPQTSAPTAPPGEAPSTLGAGLLG